MQSCIQLWILCQDLTYRLRGLLSLVANTAIGFLSDYLKARRHP